MTQSYDATCRKAADLLASDPSRANRLLEDVLASEPGHGIALYYRIYALVNLRREIEALECLANLSASDRRAGEEVRRELRAASGAKVSIGNGRFSDGNDSAALAEYRSASILDPANWDAFTGMGLVAASAGDDEAAVAHFDKALSLSPDDVPALYHRANAHARQGQFAEALVDASKAIEACPDDAPLLELRASVYRSLGRDAEADADRRRAEALLPPG